LQYEVILKTHQVVFWIGYPRQEPDLGCQYGILAPNLFDQPDSLKIMFCNAMFSP